MRDLTPDDRRCGTLEYESTLQCRRPDFDRASDADGRASENELALTVNDVSWP
jgi:hypothetical protein